MIHCELPPASGHARNLLMQVYPEFVLRIPLLLSLGRTSRRRLMREDNDRNVAE